MAAASRTALADAAAGNLAHELRAFLHEAAQRAFEYGAHDCGLMCADWIARVTDADPAHDARGAYRDEGSLRGYAGDWPFRFGEMLQEAGMVRIAVPQMGDVAIIVAHDGRLRAAICTRAEAGSFVTAAEPAGLWGIRDARLVRAWTLP